MVECPHCQRSLELISTSGECINSQYSLETVPGDVAAGILYQEFQCPDCKHRLTIEMVSQPVYRAVPWPLPKPAKPIKLQLVKS